jgi:aminocarboxymuconate-semialdehyde decarboxylase
LCAVDNPYPPRKYAAQIYLDTLVHDAEALRLLIGLFGVNRLALGSDYPFPLGELQPGRLIRGMADLSESDRSRLLGGTALEWLTGKIHR